MDKPISHFFMQIKSYFFIKEKNMAESRRTATLQRTVESQRESIRIALKRISDMSDQISLLQAELRKFKQDVAGDVKYLTERVDG
tara:strand:+ start:215 stop:469 length:255 start_codon:yes stop_codon:yes gene_type:complete